MNDALRVRVRVRVRVSALRVRVSALGVRVRVRVRVRAGARVRVSALGVRKFGYCQAVEGGVPGVKNSRSQYMHTFTNLRNKTIKSCRLHSPGETSLLN